MNWQKLLPSAPWGKRAMPRGGLMDGYFYILSGRAGMFKVYSDTWRSPDGFHWERMSANTGWGKRCYPEVELIDGNIILMGGQSLSTFYNDVWRSSDGGRTWEQVCAKAPWDVRAGHHTALINNEIFLFGGARNTGDRIFYPELWVSKDPGETWELRAELLTDMGRAGMQVVEIDGTIYFIGGDHDKPVFLPNWEGRRNDIWKSNDWARRGNSSVTPPGRHAPGNSASPITAKSFALVGTFRDNTNTNNCLRTTYGCGIPKTETPIGNSSPTMSGTPKRIHAAAAKVISCSQYATTNCGHWAATVKSFHPIHKTTMYGLPSCQRKFYEALLPSCRIHRPRSA